MFGRKPILPIDVDFELKDGKALLNEIENSSMNNVS